MDLSKIMTISGKPGLYKMIAETRNGFVVESLLDGRKMPVFPTDRSSILEDISVFTMEKDVPLKNILWKIYELKEGKPALDAKQATPDEIRQAFEEVLPDYDKDRVYISDMKKIFTWYGILLEKDMISKPEDPDAGEEESADSGTDAEDKKETSPENEKTKSDKPGTSTGKKSSK